MKLLLIPGHGAGDPGAIGTHNGKQYQEQAETRTLSSSVAKALSGYADVTVYPTTRCAYTDYQMGILHDIVTFSDYDYVLEIHFNAFKNDSGDGAVKGTEAYVVTGETNTATEESILYYMAKLGYTNRGVKKKNWSVITQAKGKGTRACLLETCFIDDKDDMALYEANRNKTAQAIAAGIIYSFGLKPKTLTPEEALGILVAKGVINTPEYWQNQMEKVEHLGLLLIKMANALL